MDKYDFVEIIVLVAIGLAVRIPRLWWGYPFLLHPDESQMLDVVFNMMRSADPNPHHFYYGHGLFYLMQLWLAPMVAFLNYITNMDAVPRVNVYTLGIATVDTPVIIPYARLLGSLIGIGLAIIVFATMRHVGSRSTATASSLLVLVSPLLVRESTWVLTNVPMAFFLSLSILFAILACSNHRNQFVKMAAVLIGVAASFKYPGGLGILIPLLHPVTKSRRSAAYYSKILLLILSGFFAVSPFVLLDPYHFFRGLGGQFLLRYSSSQTYPFSRVGLLLGWLTVGESALLLPLSLYGVWLTWRRSETRHLRFLSATYLLFASVVFANTHPFDRDLVPIIVIGSVVAGVTLNRIIRLHHLLGYALAILLILQPLVQTIRMNMLDAHPAPAISVSQWIDQHAKPQARVWADDYSMTPPSREDIVVHYVARIGFLSEDDVKRMESADYLVLATIRGDEVPKSPVDVKVIENLQMFQLIAQVHGRKIYEHIAR